MGSPRRGCRGFGLLGRRIVPMSYREVSVFGPMRSLMIFRLTQGFRAPPPVACEWRCSAIEGNASDGAGRIQRWWPRIDWPTARAAPSPVYRPARSSGGSDRTTVLRTGAVDRRVRSRVADRGRPVRRCWGHRTHRRRLFAGRRRRLTRRRSGASVSITSRGPEEGAGLLAGLTMR